MARKEVVIKIGHEKSLAKGNTGGLLIEMPMGKIPKELKKDVIKNWPQLACIGNKTVCYSIF